MRSKGSGGDDDDEEEEEEEEEEAEGEEEEEEASPLSHSFLAHPHILAHSHNNPTTPK